MWRATLKGLLAAKVRLALTALSIVLGVGFVAGTYVVGDTLNTTFDNLFADAFAGTDVVVRGDTEIGDFNRSLIPEEVLEDVREVDGVAAAEGEVEGTAQLIAPDGEAVSPMGAPTLGLSWLTDDRLNTFDVVEGRGPAAPDEILIDTDTYEEHDFRVGQDVRVIVPPGVRTYRLVGAGSFAGEGGLAGATLTIFTLEEGQRVFNAEGELFSISVRAETGVTSDELAERIGAVLPEGAEAETGRDVQQQQADQIKDQLRIITVSLLVFGFIAVFVAAFIIFNTFSITVAQRARQLALFRALGAGGGQVTRMVVAEALVVGVIASVLGLGLGVLIALGLQALLGGVGLDLPSTAIELRLRTVLVSLAVGIGVTLAAALVPALRAARLSPMAALRDDVGISEGSTRRRTVIGGVVAAIGVLLLALALQVDASTQQVFSILGAGALAIFIGLAMLAPLVARPLAGAIGAPISRLAGVPGKLGRQNSIRNPQRTARTAAALMIGLALVSFVSIFAASLSSALGDAVDRQLRIDLIVTPETFVGFPPAVTDAVAERPLVESAAGIRAGQAEVEGSTRFLGGADPERIAGLYDPVFVDGGWEDLDDDGILLVDDAADDLGVGVGDPLEVRFARTGTREFTVRGVFEEEIVAPYFVTLDAYERNFTQQLDTATLVDGRGDASPAALRAQVDEAVAGFPGVEVRDQQEFKEQLQGQIDQLLTLIYVLLALAVVIAIFGIVNTLALSIFERTREIGLLRAVGLSPRQARAMVRWESVIVSLLGGLLGIVLGVVLGVVLVSAEPEIAALSVPIGEIVVFFVLAGLAGVLAAIGPARRAARLDVLRAIAQE